MKTSVLKKKRSFWQSCTSYFPRATVEPENTLTWCLINFVVVEEKKSKETKFSLKKKEPLFFIFVEQPPRFSHKPLELLSSSISKPSTSKQKVIHKSLSSQLFFFRNHLLQQQRKMSFAAEPKNLCKEWQLNRWSITSFFSLNLLLFFY